MRTIAWPALTERATFCRSPSRGSGSRCPKNDPRDHATVAASTVASRLRTAAAWLRGELEPFAREVLSPDAIRRQGYLRPESVTRLIDEHSSSEALR